MLGDLKRRAEQEDIDAQYELGCWYGFGRHRDYKTAIYWLSKAAEQGHPASQVAVGKVLLINKKRQPEKEQQAFFWFLKAAEQGETQAYYHLSKLYLEGKGCAQNLEESTYWLQKAAEANINGSKEELKERYAYMDFLERDTERLNNLFGNTETGFDYSKIRLRPKEDPYYCTSYSPLERKWDWDFGNNPWETDEEKQKGKKHEEELKSSVNRTDFILVIEETKGGVAYTPKYSGKCDKVFLLINKYLYEVPPHIGNPFILSVLVSRNANNYFKNFYAKVHNARDLQGRLCTFSKCERYEDYFIVKIPGEFEGWSVSMENEKIKLFVEKFKKNCPLVFLDNCK